ncbi:zinc finger and BTB domain-containing protein 8A.2-like isoform X2 [Mixophyes fleayi]|uniref:zinc finger and BTB domain-containing protein 8A.2-like isoform X2 n=1 Tax=Mixophyes fleayi TaxID=3061075 RepID=UPI003F4D9BC0
MDFSSHHIRLLQQLDEQRRKDLFCDCHIMVEGQMFKAHRNILFASSGYFKMLLSQSCKDASQPTTATFDAFSADTLAAILDFVYSGKLPLSGQNVIEVMSAASYLQMTDVISVCKMFIKSSLDINEKDRDGHYSMSDRDLRRHSDRYGVYSEGWGMDCCHSNQKHSNISGCIENDHSWNAYGIYPRTSELSSNQTNKTTATKTLVRRHDVQQLPSSTCSPENLESECNNSETISTTCGTDLLNDRYATEATEANLNCWTVTQHRASKTDQLYASMPTIMGVVGGWGEDVLPSMRFKCPFCTHMVKRKTDLKRHLRCHTGERPYPCKVCGKRFTRLEHVRTHFRTIHEAGKPICRRCKRHVTDDSGQVVQEGTKRFRLCNECVVEVGVSNFSIELDDDDTPIILSGDEGKEPPWNFNGGMQTSEPQIIEDTSSDMVIHEVVDSDEDI